LIWLAYGNRQADELTNDDPHQKTEIDSKKRDDGNCHIEEEQACDRRLWEFRFMIQLTIFGQSTGAIFSAKGPTCNTAIRRNTHRILLEHVFINILLSAPFSPHHTLHNPAPDRGSGKTDRPAHRSQTSKEVLHFLIRQGYPLKC
jgi:hypothetical protein